MYKKVISVLLRGFICKKMLFIRVHEMPYFLFMFRYSHGLSEAMPNKDYSHSAATHF